MRTQKLPKQSVYFVELLVALLCSQDCVIFSSLEDKTYRLRD